MIRDSLWALGAALLLAACAAPAGRADPAHLPAPQVAPAWQAPLPHAGSPTDLLGWWSRFNDPALVQLIGAAQAASPTLASAAARIEQARAARVSAASALGPQVDALANASRGRADSALPVATIAGAGLQASWEIDLFGANRAGRDAAEARLQGAQASWHDARVSLAAEVAASYTTLRACEAQSAQLQVDVVSREQTAHLTQLAARAGLLAPASAALARASAAQGRSLATALGAQCDTLVKALVALTALDEPALRRQLAAGTGQLPQPAAIVVTPLPAGLLAQRPDLFVAERAVLAAAADVDTSQAAQLPRVSLEGSLGLLGLSTGAGSSSGATWSIGPVQVTFPLYDGGARVANTAAARTAYDAAVVLYQASVRNAVREVETSLVVLQGTAARNADARVAAEGFEASFRASEARFKGGLGSLFELEDARRSAVLANIALIELQRERAAAWIALYRALGGGWAAEAVLPVRGAS